ncbi:MAG: hypothetical protein WD069_11230 [Planctomycetales bacterium]
MALLVVMVAIALSLTLTVAFLQTQATLSQIDANVSRRDAALQAAQTGAAVALREMQAAGWAGVEKPLTATVVTDDAGSASYRVTFEKPPAIVSNVPQELGLCLVVKSVGTWSAAGNSAEKTQRTVEVLVRLQPRLAGRTVRAGDNAAADDLSPNPGSYDQIQQYALYAERDTSLVLDPQDRIDGQLRLQSGIALFGDPAWSSSIRTEYLKSVGAKHVASGSPRHPHPFGANGIPSTSPLVIFERSASSSLRNDLDRLGVSYAQTSESLTFPGADYSGWKRYRLYAGGFEYDAQTVGARLKNATLGPTDKNPLGIFYRQGPISVEENLTIVGTLVSTDTITFSDHSIHLASCQPRDGLGELLFPDAGQWPRLPAVVAEQVEIDRGVRMRIEGAVVVQRQFRGAGGDFEYLDVPNVDIVGTAISRPIAQPSSRVTIAGTQSLAAVRGEEQHAIWLASGTSGSWYPIRDVDAARRELTIVGQAEHASPTNFRIRRNRRRYVEIRGPVSGEQHDINRTNAWGNVSSIAWGLLYSRWDSDNRDRQSIGLPPIEFVDWLANPSNFSGWGFPYTSYGLPLDPTFHLEYAGGDRYRWSPPLFRPWTGTQSLAVHSGYRWKVLSWRELP